MLVSSNALVTVGNGGSGHVVTIADVELALVNAPLKVSAYNKKENLN